MVSSSGPPISASSVHDPKHMLSHLGLLAFLNPDKLVLHSRRQKIENSNQSLKNPNQSIHIIKSTVECDQTL